MMLIWVFFYSNLYNISNRLVSTAENRQKKWSKSGQNEVKIPPTAVPAYLNQNLRVASLSHFCGPHKKFQISSSYRSRDIIELYRKPPTYFSTKEKTDQRLTNFDRLHYSPSYRCFSNCVPRDLGFCRGKIGLFKSMPRWQQL
jgi:hypothetical protein